MSAEGTRRAIFAAFFANLGIAISKFVAFAITGSASMLAEAIHSVADTGNQGLLFLGGQRSRKAPTAEHQFGFGRERYFWAFVVALVLFTLGSMFALYEGIEKLIDPHELDSPIVGVQRARCRDRARVAVAAHRAPRGAPEPRGPVVVALHPHDARAPSSRSCCSKTPARSIGLCLALGRHQPGRDHRRSRVGRGRQHRDRPAARCHRGRARDRDEEPAHR